MGFQDDTSSEWVRCARAGDRKAVDRLYTKYGPPLTRYVAQRMGAARRWTEPEDIVQQSLMEVLGRLDTLPEAALGRAFSVRLKRVARQRILDELRAHGRDRGSSVAPEVNDRISAHSDGSVTNADTLRWLKELVDRLPDKYRDVVHLCAFEQYSYAEAGERLGLSTEAVRKRYERARDTLTRKLAAREQSKNGHGE